MGCREWPQGESVTQPDLPGATYATALPLVEEALRHPKCRILVNALGTPPPEVVETVQSGGRLVGALCGRVTQAVAHAEAGLDFVVAQGGEGGGHAGEIPSIVLWPQVVDAIAPLPVLAAGGIGNGRQMLAAMADRCRRHLDRITLGDGCGSSRGAGAEGRLSARVQRRHGSFAELDRQDRPGAQKRLDRGVGPGGVP